MPDVCRRITEEAAAEGADMVLSGRGSDEQLMCTRFTALALRRRRGLAVLRRYLADMSHYDGARGMAGELLSLLSPALGRRWSFGLLYGVMWSNAHEPDRAGILPPARAEHAVASHRAWVAEQRAMVEAHDFDWPSIAARCAIYPRDNVPSAGPVPWVSPFLDADFVHYANRLDIADRYDPRLPHAYHRVKAPVLRLFPAHLHAFLPAEKQTFGRACDRYLAACAPTIPSRCLELGLVVEDWRSAVARDDRLAIVVAMVETWLEGCAERGMAFSEDVPEAAFAPQGAG
jgi:asparagine synthetase B (glutamine-hydrolysing)